MLSCLVSAPQRLLLTLILRSDTHIFFLQTIRRQTHPLRNSGRPKAPHRPGFIAASSQTQSVFAWPLDWPNPQSPLVFNKIWSSLSLSARSTTIASAPNKFDRHQSHPTVLSALVSIVRLCQKWRGRRPPTSPSTHTSPTHNKNSSLPHWLRTTLLPIATK